MKSWHCPWECVAAVSVPSCSMASVFVLHTVYFRSSSSPCLGLFNPPRLLLLGAVCSVFIPTFLLQQLKFLYQDLLMTGLKLSPDNLSVSNSSVFLLGSLLKDKQINVTNYWAFDNPTSLTISIPDSFTIPQWCPLL